MLGILEHSYMMNITKIGSLILHKNTIQDVEATENI